MSDWLAGMPESWGPVPVKSIFIERKETALAEALHLTPSQTYGVLPQADYMERTGSRVVQVLEGGANMKAVGPDDFVIHLRSFQGGIEHSTFRGKVSPAYTVLTPKPCLEPRYYRWLLKSRGYIQELQSTTNQLRDGQSIKFKDFASIPLPFPPLEKQRAIADYLDRETAQIDFLLDRISTLKVQVEERLGVLISEVLRGSLEPNSAMVETSDEALGLIPAGWEAKRLKFLGNSIIGLTYAPEDLCDPGEDSTPVIRAGNIQSGRLVDTDTVHVSKAIPENLRLRIDDIVICARNGSAKLIGKNAIVGPNWESATWGAFMVVFRSDLNNFLHWVFKSEIFKSRLGSFSTSTINQLTSAQLNNLLVPVPPIRERDRICAYLSGVSKETEKLLDRLVLLHRFAQERRAALITAAVTGQIDVSQGRAA